MENGTLLAIHIAPHEGDPMESLAVATLVVDHGIEGDRNFGGNPAAGITLIEEMELATAAQGVGAPYVPGMSRRNLTVSGIALQPLIGQRFQVGEVLLEGTFSAEPCELMENCIGPGAKELLVHKAGIRARVLTGGIIRPGDPIAVVPVTDSQEVTA